MERPLQPPRVPAGWTVKYNQLHEVDPSDVNEDDRYTYLKEDLLQMTLEHFNRLLDVGWYPEGKLKEGSYRLVVYERDFRGTLLFELRTADRSRLVAEVERLLQEVCDRRL